MSLAKSCDCSGVRDWIAGVRAAHMEKNALKVRGTVSAERTVGGVPGGRTEGGRGMLGGVVLDRSAAKYKQRAGPGR